MNETENAVKLALALVGAGVTDPKQICEALNDFSATLEKLNEGKIPVAAVSVGDYMKAIERGSVCCLECGEEVESLGAHALKAHGLNWAAYANKWKAWFKAYNIMPQKAGRRLSEERRERALRSGLGEAGRLARRIKAKTKEVNKVYEGLKGAELVEAKERQTVIDAGYTIHNVYGDGDVKLQAVAEALGIRPYKVRDCVQKYGLMAGLAVREEEDENGGKEVYIGLA